jgi:phosphatidylglycerophosphatase C
VPNWNVCLADSSARQTIVFDFDQTIFAGDIGFEITHSRILRSPWRCALGLLLLPIYAPLFLHARSLRWGIGIAYWLSTVAARNDDQQVFFAVHGAALRERLFPQALATLSEAQAQDTVVVIATGAMPDLVRALLQPVLKSMPEVIGSKTRRFCGGLALAQHCHRSEKLRMLEEAGFPPPYAIAYSDSLADTPLFAASQRVVLVNANDTQANTLQQRLGRAIERVTWSRPSESAGQA